MSLLLIDARTSGAAGDLLIAALLDIQMNEFRDTFCEMFNELLVKYDPDFQVKWFQIKQQGFSGTQIQTSAVKKFLPDVMTSIVEDLGKQLEFSPKGTEIASKALTFLINAELKVHGYDNLSDNIHFHELATIDTVFDIIGFVFLLEKMDFLQNEMKTLPIAVGGGTIKISHGEVPVPAPATAEIIREGKLLITGGPTDGELLTPTGAALIASLNAETLHHFPLMHIQKIGRSFGTRKSKEGFSSGLVIIQGYSPSILEKEEISTLETNVDDVDGETLGHLFTVLYEQNLVLDLTLISTISKKNRPGFLVRAIVEPGKAMEVIKILSRELGTLGVRISSGFRHIIPRELKSYQIKLEGSQEVINYKTGLLGSEVISEKIEFDDLQRLARKEGVALREMRKRISLELHKKDDNNA